MERSMPQEVLAENRFLAARDGMDAELIEPELGRRVPARELLADLVAVCRPHAEALGCAAELDAVILPRRAHRRPAPARAGTRPWARCRAWSALWPPTSLPGRLT